MNYAVSKNVREINDNLSLALASTVPVDLAESFCPLPTSCRIRACKEIADPLILDVKSGVYHDLLLWVSTRSPGNFYRQVAEKIRTGLDGHGAGESFACCGYQVFTARQAWRIRRVKI